MIPKVRMSRSRVYGFRHNTVWCCKECNNRKGNLTPLEFFMGLPQFQW